MNLKHLKFASKKRRPTARRETGSMVSMSILCICILLFACVVGFGLYMLMSEQKRGQHKADQLAMTLAAELNMGDKAGQMNFITARSRELVYQSREFNNYTQGGWMSFCSPLTNQLLNEAINGAHMIDEERKNQNKLTKQRLIELVQDYNSHLNTNAELTLPGWKTYQPQVIEIRLGSVAGVKSNVEHNEIYEDLIHDDTHHKLFDERTKLYFGNIDAKLPPPDTSIPFKLSSLPAPVENTIAPARLVNPEMFVYAGSVFQGGKDSGTKLDQIPSAVQLVEQMPISLQRNNQAVQVGATAATSGGAPEPDWSINKNDR